MRTLDPGFSTITQRIGRPAVMAAGTAAIIGGVAAAVIICAAAWFFYTLSKYPTKSDKWMHCYASCKIASYCGVIPGVGSVISALIGGGKEIADWIGDQFGLHMQAEWEDFMADIEGAFLCGGWGIFSGSCYDCCDKKRGKK